MKKKRLEQAILITVFLTSPLFAEGTKQLNSIIVTANKFEQNLEDIPQSISIIDDVTIEERRLTNINEVVKLIPNMSLTTDAGTTVNFRGLNTSRFTNTNPIAIYMDGIPSTDKYGYDLYLENIERIEVLRGPQGTLYGKNAIGGVINVISKRPENYTQGNISVEYGSNNFNMGKINLNGPIIKDTLFYSFSGRIQKDDGWITNTYPGMNKDANRQKKSDIKASLYYEEDRLSSRLTLVNSHNKKYWFDGYALAFADFQGIDSLKRDDSKKVSFDTETLEETKLNSQSLNIKYDFDNFIFNSITTNKKLEYEGIDDLDYIALPGNKFFDKTTTKTLSQEFRISNISQDGVKWLAGVYSDKEDREQDPFGMEFFGMMKNSASKMETKSQAIFSQAMIPLNDFELTVGGRYQKIDTDFDVITTSNIPSEFSLSTKKSWSNFIPKIGLTYKVHEYFTPFMSISKGYVPGGFNFVAESGEVEDNSFKPQKSTNYELGFKSNLDDLILSGTIFRMDIEDIHVYKIIGSTVSTDNAKKAHSQGIEIEATYFINDSFNISSAFGLIDAKYDDYFDGNSFDGERIRRTPKHTTSISLSYKNPNGFYSIFDVNSQGEMEVYDRNIQKQVKLDDYITANLKIGYKKDDWNLYLYVVNLTDEEYLTSLTVPPLTYTAEFGDPRKVGLGLKYSF